MPVSPQIGREDYIPERYRDSGLENAYQSSTLSRYLTLNFVPSDAQK